jgi:hypothetical protein
LIFTAENVPEALEREEESGPHKKRGGVNNSFPKISQQKCASVLASYTPFYEPALRTGLF